MARILYVIYLAVAVPATAAASCAVYLVRVPVTYLAALTRVLLVRPSWLPDPERWPEAPGGSDPAVLAYFYGPATADAVHVATTAFEASRRRWGLGVNSALRSSRQRGSALGGPLGPAAAAGMTVGTAAGVVVAACGAALHIAIVGISATLVRASAAALNGAGSVVSRGRRNPVTCLACGKPVASPLYACTGNGCKQRHRDLRPGRLGIFRRRCHCGSSMRTVLLPGSRAMTGLCPHCGQFLQARPGGEAEVAVPVFGMLELAKRELLLRMATQLKVWDREGKLNAVLADPPVVPEVGAGWESSRGNDPGQDRAQDDGSSAVPHAYTIRLIDEAGATVVRLFDAAGTADGEPSPAERAPQPAMPGKVRTLVVVTGPMSFGSDPAQQARQAAKSLGIAAGDARVAVVFAGGDPLAGSGGRAGRWVRRQLKSGRLILPMRREFNRCRVFYLSERMPDGVMRDSVESLDRWVLLGDGISPSPSRVVPRLGEVRERSYRWQRAYVFASMVAVGALLVIFLL
jgi:hypothetical protein